MGWYDGLWLTGGKSVLKWVSPNKQVILVVGDGGFQMTCEDLAMVRQYNLPLRLVIINNGYLGMVRQWQQIFNDRHSYVDLEVSPDYFES